MKKYIIPITLMLTLGGCKNEEETKEIPKEQFCLNENFMSNTDVETVQKQVVTEGIHLTGSIESNPDKVIHFVSRWSNFQDLFFLMRCRDPGTNLGRHGSHENGTHHCRTS